MFKGIVVNDETLAVDVIREVGPGGNFLGQKHTRNNMYNRWQPEFMDRRPYDLWEKTRDGARDWAGEKAQKILSDYHPEPRDENLQSELRKIISSVESNLT
jgi:trimethylamine--corrinoid protein Co-methyltransferase